VYGFSGRYNTSNNLWYNASGGFVYYAAAVGVVYTADAENKAQVGRQKFFLKHDNDITCIAAHPSRDIFATGQQQSSARTRRPLEPPTKGRPYVYIWDSETRMGPDGRKQPVRLELPVEDKEVGCVAFSRRPLGHGAKDDKAGDLLLTVARDAKHTIRVWHWKQDAEKCTASGEGMHGTPPQVFGAVWNEWGKEETTGHRSDFVTFGVQHITFWEYSDSVERDGKFEARLSQKSAQFGRGVSGSPQKHDVLCVCYLPTGHVLAGYENGSVAIFDHPRANADMDGGHGEMVRQRALAKKEGGDALVSQLKQKRSLKTVAVQEILHAHKAAVKVEPGSDEGQWGYKWGGCTALVLAAANDVIFSGGGDGRIIEWRLGMAGLAGDEVPLSNLRHGMVDDTGGSDILTPRRVFDARVIDSTGPPRMFVGLDTRDNGTERYICAGDTENDIWQITQRGKDFNECHYAEGEGNHEDFKFELEGQSDSVFGIAPFPVKIVHTGEVSPLLLLSIRH
jgi:hypothetical protein